MDDKPVNQCPLCGTKVPRGVTTCPLCATEIRGVPAEGIALGGVPRSSEDFLHREIPKVVLPEEKHTCPLCALELKGKETKCPRCGVPLSIPKEEGMLECPECGTLAPLGSSSCPKCGVIFEEMPGPPPVEELPPPPEPILERGPVSRPPAAEAVIQVPPSAPPTSRGLTNGRGAVNGTGFVNGTGMINGTKGETGLRAAKKEKMSLTRWQFLAVLIALLVVIPAFIYLSYYQQPREFAVDGDFGEWSHADKFGVYAQASSAPIAVSEWSVESEGSRLFTYVCALGPIMSSSDVSSYYLFVDSDNSASTGYLVSGIGADYLLQIDGWSGSVQSTELCEYGSNSDKYDWNSWDSIDSVSTSMEGNELEAMAEMPVTLSASARYMLMAQNSQEQRTLSYTVPESGGLLVVEIEAGTDVDLDGLVGSSTTVSIARMYLTCEGESGTVRSISPSIAGASLVSPIEGISLKTGEERAIEVLVDTSSAPAGSLVNVSVGTDDVDSTFAGVQIVGDDVRALVASAPSEIQIDGAFADWVNRTSMDSDFLDIMNDNIDIDAIGAVNGTSYSAFYVSVMGEMCSGSYVPIIKEKPSGGGGGGGYVIPTRKTGEDILRVYIDSDMNHSTGYPKSHLAKAIGADYLIEVKGLNGNIVSRSLLNYSAGQWHFFSGAVNAAKDGQRLEMSVSSSSLGGASSIGYIVETTDWRLRTDAAWTGDSKDPWAITSSGDTYASDTGALWNSMGAPALEPGDAVVDLSTDPARDIVYAVTNSGRTYRWVVGTSSAWSANMTDPIGGTANVVAIALYSDAAAFILTQDGRPFYDADLTTTLTWTARPTIPKGHTDYLDLVWESGSTPSTAALYAMRLQQNSKLLYSADGGTTDFTEIKAATGANGPHAQFAVIPGATQSQDQLFVLQESGRIRYTSNGAGSWSTRGNLPTPGVGNSSTYMGISIDVSSNVWVITDTGYCYVSTDGAQTFTYTGQTPAASLIVGFTTPIPEFGLMPFVTIALMAIVLLPIMTRRKKT